MDGLSRQERYEQSGKRPGTPISTRLDDEELRAVDKARGAGKRNEISRSAWLHKLIRSALKLSAEEE